MRINFEKDDGGHHRHSIAIRNQPRRALPLFIRRLIYQFQRREEIKSSSQCLNACNHVQGRDKDVSAFAVEGGGFATLSRSFATDLMNRVLSILRADAIPAKRAAETLAFPHHVIKVFQLNYLSTILRALKRASIGRQFIVGSISQH